MRVLFTGGGTGGHLYPILSLAHGLARADDSAGDCEPVARQVAHTGPHSLLFVGARGHMDRQLLERDGIAYVGMDSKPLLGRGLLRSAGSLAANAAAMLHALPVVKQFAPDVIVAGGGYASAPAVLAGAVLRRLNVLPALKIVLLEPNVAPGYANRRLAGVASEVWGAYPESPSARFFKEKFRLTGVPVRSELYAPMAKADARRSLGLDPGRFTLLVFGGSQGARSLNLAVSGMAARRRLPEDWQIFHIAGERDFEWMRAERKTESNANRYRVVAYLEQMPLALWAADVAVCRAGASALAELCTVGLPCLLVPYPHAAEDHQRANAAYLEERGAAVSMPDDALNADSLYWALMEIVDGGKLLRMAQALRRLARPHAVQGMVERLIAGRIGAAETTAA
ncbi:MAG: UDP-N-acetylglucosamine--N-acetylmuramyl-(pentapeptide) pyrophosphoryl-undecaprenol N-acetylglucosamine transferase [Candidatus Eremiobacteraeota bacterium]|nr:UDP-N-acetylglucosamine--N-acetylmuramyl-(pentapeptide) pyrophosphoryl-undecaprenol N-acetylglucosamine transferase [Candidatus Eremiobacteraeota bacterium]